MIAKRNWFLRKVWQTIRRHEMIEPGDRVVVGVSGGADSVALAVTLATLAEPLDFTLLVAHLNHQLRPAADEDEAFVSDLAKRLGLIVHTRRLPPGSLGPGGIEARARDLRYAYFREVAEEFRCNKVATGHTLDDQAETILMRLLRGSGVWGLRGIMAVRPDGVIRPLLQCSRTETRRFLRELEIPWREDETNSDARFLRNFVRAEVVPKLEEVQPKFAETAARLAELVQEELESYEFLLAEKLQQIAAEDGTLDLEILRKMPPQVRKSLLRRWLQEKSGESVEAEFVRDLSRRVELGENFSMNLPPRADRRRVVSARRSRMVFETHASDLLDWEPVRLRAPSVCELPGGWTLHVKPYPSPPPLSVLSDLTKGEMNAFVDVDLLHSELWVRPTRPGDEIVPFGLGGKKKLQDVFTDRRVPRTERWGRPAVADGEVIVWVPGVVRAEHALVQPHSRSLWLLCAVREADTAGGT